MNKSIFYVIVSFVLSFAVVGCADTETNKDETNTTETVANEELTPSADTDKSDKSNYDLLQGTWVLETTGESTDGEATSSTVYEIKIEGHGWTDIFDGTEQIGNFFVQSNDCTDNIETKSNDDGQILTAFTEEEGNLCYKIVSIDNQKLSLQMIKPMVGSVGVYTRK